jgi:translocation and assembly module TamA
MCFLPISHSAVIHGVKDPELLSLIRSQISDWKNFSHHAVANEFRLKKDETVVKTIASSFGYFDVTVKSSINKDFVLFVVKLNDRYKFNDISLNYTDQKKYSSGLKVGQIFDLINIEHDSYTTTKQISDGKDKIRSFFKKRGFAFVNVLQPKVEIDKGNKKIKATYDVTLNGKVIIDHTILNIKSKKDSHLIEPFIRNRIPWKDGDVYDSRKISSMREDLMSSGIFAGMEVILSTPIPDKEDSNLSHTTMTINIDEALLRDISAGVKYGSSEKAGALFSWTHYNIDGRGAKLSTILDVAKNTKIVRVKYDTYDLFYKKQNLATQGFYVKEKTSSYEVSKMGAESILWQNFGVKFKAGLGACCEHSKTKDKIDTTNSKFKAFGVPIGLNFDTTDNYIDPQSGIRCLGMVTPYFSNNPNITILSGKSSVYFPIKKNMFKTSMVIAVYTKVGSILRNKNRKIPRDKLFFAGGSGSIRGYGYQKVGKITDDKRPYGGESLFEVGIEPRVRITEDIGLVTFLEGGNVYSSKMPQFFKKPLFGYGIGMRYYTPLGPIRLDLAFPTKRRKNSNNRRVDSMFNIYISIGQAF